MNRLVTFILCLVLAATAKAQVTFTVTDTPCNNDGVLTASVSSMVPPYTFKWTTFGLAATTIIHTSTTGTDVLTSYSGGPVNLSVFSGSDSLSTHFGGAPPFYYEYDVTPAICPGTIGSATVIPFGGTPPYSYNWYNSTTLATVATSSVVSLPLGEYGVTVTDAAGCQFGSMSDNNRLPTIRSVAAFSVATATTPAACTNGTATASVTGGAVPPLSYLWSSGATTSSISGLVMGMYNIAVTDALGCTDSVGVYISQVPVISVPVTTTPATCTNSDGAVIAFGSGGVPPYSYLWSNGATTASQTGLPVGLLNVTATDANGCFGYGSAKISVSTPITVTYSATPSSCIIPTGSATLVPAGGTAPYSYTWYTTPVQTTATATALAPGTHNFRVVDAVGCIQSGTVVVPPVSNISANIVSVAPVCLSATGAMTVTASGGTLPYTYHWSTGATSPSVSGVPAGYYTVDVTDAAGCTVRPYRNLAASSPVTVGISAIPESCIFAGDGVLTATPSGGTPPYTYAWTGGATTASATGLAHNCYWVTVTDAVGCAVSRYTYLNYNPADSSCYCTIRGIVYHDANNNCTQDAGEPGVENIGINVSGRGTVYTDATGYYAMKVPSGAYTLSEVVLSMYPLSSCQSNSIPVSATASSGCTIPVSFANQVNPIHDIRFSTWDYNRAVPGNSYTQVNIVKNMGTIAEASTITGYKPDGQLLAPSFVPSGVFTGAPYYYSGSTSFPSLSPGAEQTVYANYSVPTSIPLGTSVLFKDSSAYTAPMSNWLTDYSPWDNVNYFTTVVVSSYDPNFKEVKPKGDGPEGTITYADSVLEYMVHFQNTGSWFAQNIVVIDTLDDDLDASSLRPVYASAKCNISIDEEGSLRIAKFTFPNINLPAQSMDDLRSNGMFSFTIKTKPRLPLGTAFTNRASIYFDYNEPVLTNAVINTLGLPKGIKIVDGSFFMFPNPAGRSFNIVLHSEGTGHARFQVTDLTGKVLISNERVLTAGTQAINVDVSQLASSIYLVTVLQDGKTSTQKLVIVK